MMMYKKESKNMKIFIIKYLKDYRFIFLVLGFLGFFGVKKFNEFHEKKNVVESTVNSSIQLNTEIDNLQLSSDTTINLASYLKSAPFSYKAIISLDGSCSVCLTTLQSWKEFIRKEQIGLDKVIFIVYDATPKQMDYTVKQMVDTPLKIFIDPHASYSTLNKITPLSPLKSVLVNDTMQIVSAGDLFEDKTVFTTFSKYLIR